MAITRTAWTDDDGSGLTGTVINNAEKVALYDQIDAALAAEAALQDAALAAAAIATTAEIVASGGYPCDGRLTLTTALPVTTADVTAATTIYFTPFKGNKIALYSGSAWAVYTFTERSLALGTLTADKPYDVFIYNNAGTLTLEFLVWTNLTTRATALVLQDGVLCKSGALTRRYLGTFYTVSTTTTEDSFAKRFLWNYYNRVRRTLRALEATDSWTYTTATIRQANGSTANQLAFVIGIAEVEVAAEVLCTARNTAANVTNQVLIGEDSTTTMATGCLTPNYVTQVANLEMMPYAALRKYPTPGYHFWSWLEFSAATGTTTWFGDAGVPTRIQSGIHGSIEG
jgi:hypothetical protein